MSAKAVTIGSGRKGGASRSARHAQVGLLEHGVKLAMAVAVVVIGVRLLVTRPPEAVQGVNPSPPATLQGLEDALRANPISPYRWIEAAEGYDLAGDSAKALFCLHRAEQLGPNLPPIWIRAAAFYFRLGDAGQGLKMGARAQAITPDADEFLFQYYDRFAPDTGTVLEALAGDSRASLAYFRHLLAKGTPEDVDLAWAQLEKLGAANLAQRVRYVDFLLARRRFEAAQTVWAAAGAAGGQTGYPGLNRIYNGGFEAEPTGSALDWKAEANPAVEMERDQSMVKDGKASFRINFLGNENVRFHHLSETAVVTPGRYTFSAWLKTDVITTDEGVRFCIADAESPANLSIQSEVTRGTVDWTEVRILLTVPPATHILNISLCRNPSLKFDSKIAGKVWIDSVSLKRLN
jgi:tetratricopeptide (TPR) repeat protein